MVKGFSACTVNFVLFALIFVRAALVVVLSISSVHHLTLKANFFNLFYFFQSLALFVVPSVSCMLVVQ